MQRLLLMAFKTAVGLNNDGREKGSCTKKGFFLFDVQVTSGLLVLAMVACSIQRHSPSHNTLDRFVTESSQPLSDAAGYGCMFEWVIKFLSGVKIFLSTSACANEQIVWSATESLNVTSVLL